MDRNNNALLSDKIFTADNISKEKRSKVMASIRGKNTKPELMIRKMLWAEGIRYRIHSKTIFGTPDISMKNRKLAVFIDGCFWHGCKKCYKEPKSNTEFWRNKIGRNKARRKTVRKELRKSGWSILEIWEHDIHSNSRHELEKILQHVKNEPYR